MSTDYRVVCFTCKDDEGPIFASGSGFYGYRVWQLTPEDLEWFGHRQDIGKHENHDLRIVSEHTELPFQSGSEPEGE